MPQLPRELAQALSKPPHLSVGPAVQQLRNQRTGYNDTLAQAFEEHQIYLDSLQTTQSKLLAFIQSLVIPSTIYTATFVFGRAVSDTGVEDGADIVAGDATNEIPIPPPGGTCFLWLAIMDVAPVGQDAIFDIKKMVDGVGTSIFDTQFPTIPAGSLDTQSGVHFKGTVTLHPKGVATSSKGDTLKGFVNQAGSTTPGQSATVILAWK